MRFPEDGAPYSVNVWVKPEIVTAEMIEAARAALPAALAATTPAKGEKLVRWLVALGTLCAGKMTPNEVKAKVSTYAEMIQVPDLVLNKASLREAAKRFQWFPSFNELEAFLKRQAEPVTGLAARIGWIANSRPTEVRSGSRYADLPADKKAKIDAILAEAYANIGAAGRSAIDEVAQCQM